MADLGELEPRPGAPASEIDVLLRIRPEIMFDGIDATMTDWLRALAPAYLDELNEAYTEERQPSNIEQRRASRALLGQAITQTADEATKKSLLAAWIAENPTPSGLVEEKWDAILGIEASNNFHVALGLAGAKADHIEDWLLEIPGFSSDAEFLIERLGADFVHSARPIISRYQDLVELYKRSSDRVDMIELHAARWLMDIYCTEAINRLRASDVTEQEILRLCGIN